MAMSLLERMRCARDQREQVVEAPLKAELERAAWRASSAAAEIERLRAENETLGAFATAEIGPLIMDEIDCSVDAKTIITVGSVGQPRDRDPRACCGIYDTQTKVFTFKRMGYDVHGARQKILDAGLAPVFGERLLVGM